jgi:hypothetical protein
MLAASVGGPELLLWQITGWMHLHWSSLTLQLAVAPALGESPVQTYL